MNLRPSSTRTDISSISEDKFLFFFKPEVQSCLYRLCSWTPPTTTPTSLHPVTHTYILILSYHTCVSLYLRFMSLSYSSYHIPLLLNFYHLIYKPHHLIHCHKTMKQEIIIRYFSLRINFI